MLKPLIIKLKLTSKQHELAKEYQKTYEKLFDKTISLEELFKISMFFSLNINKTKLAILDSYNTETVDKEDKEVAKHNTNNQKEEIANKKGLLEPRTKQGKQTTLEGIAPIRRVKNANL